MESKDKIPQHALDRTAQRIWMVDQLHSEDQSWFIQNIVDEWDGRYKALWVPDNKIKAVQSISSRVREFFGWEVALQLVSAYRLGNVRDFYRILGEFFESSDDTYSPMDIEACMHRIPTNKTINSDWLRQKIKDLVQKFCINQTWAIELNRWRREAGYHFHQLWKDENNQWMTWIQILEEFSKIK